MAIFSALGWLLTAPETLKAFTTAGVKDHLPLILAQMLVVGLVMLAARLYRRHWPLYLEPWLAFMPVNLYLVGYGARWLGQALSQSQFCFVWLGLGLVHLVAAARLDRAKVRYAHGVYLGGYLLVLLAILFTLPDPVALVWTLGIGLVVAAGSAVLVHLNRHHTWADLVQAIFRQPESLGRSVLRNTFVWFMAWLLPVWSVLLLRQFNVGYGFEWLGVSLVAVVYLGLGVRLGRLEVGYGWPFHSAAQFFTLLSLISGVPLTGTVLFGQFVAGTPLAVEVQRVWATVLLQGVVVAFYAASAWVYRRGLLAHLASWLVVAPYTLAWVGAAPELSLAQFGLVWTGLVVGLLVVGAGLDQRRTAQPVAFGHGPYLVGYVLAGLALAWSIPDRLTHLYVLAVGIAVALVSHGLVHLGRHHTYEDFIGLMRLKSGTVTHRAARTVFLFLAVYAFPVWLVQLLTYHELPLAWRGLALALVAPLYVAAGLAVGRMKVEYTWPLYSAGYALTAIGAMVAFDNELLAIYVLALDAVVYVVSAYIFRRTFWLYLSTTLVPAIALLVLHYNQALSAPWVAGVFMGLAFLYFGLGQWFNRLSYNVTTTAGVASYALPCYVPGYLLSAVALAAASSDRSLALAIYPLGVLLYGLSARMFREALFLYPAAWLVAVPYYLGLTLSPLPPVWYGLGWLPLMVGYIALGRRVWRQTPPASGGGWSILTTLTQPAMPFYLLAYVLSVGMIILSRSDALVLSLAFTAAAALYLASAALFRRATWLYPGLLAGAPGLNGRMHDSPRRFGRLPGPTLPGSYLVHGLAWGLVQPPFSDGQTSTN